MKIIIVKDMFEGGKVGFEHLEKAMQKGQIHVLGLATGSTPITFYDEIVKSNLDFQQLISINLDEYYGLAADHEQSYHTFMKKHLFNQKPFKINYLPNGLETDAEKECQRYDQIIDNNPIDLQILGIGENGHIGFNEPGTAFDSTTHKVSLTESTIAANARFFASEEEVPHFAYSMGIQSIMSAKEIVLFAYGEHKKEAIRRLVEEPETLDLPASALKSHPNVTLILDEAAASALTHS